MSACSSAPVWGAYLEAEDPTAPVLASAGPYLPSAAGPLIGAPRAPAGKGPAAAWRYDEYTQVEAADFGEELRRPLIKGARPRPPPVCLVWGEGVRVKEVFAGTARWTQAQKERGFAAYEHVEYYRDPIRQRGPRPEHDLRRLDVRQALLLEVRAAPGPGVANTWQWGTPCGTFCAGYPTLQGARTVGEPSGAQPDRRGSRGELARGKSPPNVCEALCQGGDGVPDRILCAGRKVTSGGL